MKFVFHKIGICERIIQTVLSDYLQTQGIAGTFYSISNQKNWSPTGKEKEADYLVFYRIYVPYEPERTRIFIKKSNMKAKIVALCRNDHDGIKALEKGSDYALRLPLSPETIIHCYKHFQPNKLL